VTKTTKSFEKMGMFALQRIYAKQTV